MPWTALVFLIGSLALCGFPGLSGFFSKDEILALAHERNAGLYVLGVVTAGLTAFYITRCWWIAFIRKPSHGLHPHESGPMMLLPLGALAVLSIVGGYLGLPAFLGEPPEPLRLDVAATSVIAMLAGIGVAYATYARGWISAPAVAARAKGLYTVLVRRYYVDEAYAWYVDRVQQRVIAAACLLVERRLIIGTAVNGVAWLTKSAGHLIRRVQTGLVQGYVLVFCSGVAIILYVALKGAR